MTTAARPTFDPARGGKGKWEGDLSAMSKQYSARDLPGHTRLKSRQEGQGVSEEVRGRGEMRRDLEDREVRAGHDRQQRAGGRVSGVVTGGGHEKRDRGSRATADYTTGAKRVRIDPVAANVDADDPLEEDYDEEGGSPGGGGGALSDSDDEEETAELMAELARIKRERAAESAKLESEKKVEEERIRTENILKGNPLLNQAAAGIPSASSDFKVKRRWDDDVVFKNCARGEIDKSKRGFINDTLRSEFHKKFMEKYIQ